MVFHFPFLAYQKHTSILRITLTCDFGAEKARVKGEMQPGPDEFQNDEVLLPEALLPCKK